MTSPADAYEGSYTDKTFPNPVVVSTKGSSVAAGSIQTTNAALNWDNIGRMYYDPQDYAPGSLGKIISNRLEEGPF